MSRDIEQLWREFGLSLFRVSVGAMMLFGHGWGKFFKLLSEPSGFPDPLGLGSTMSLGLAAGAEFGCSILLIFGLATRFATIPLIFTMGVAIFVVHGADPWGEKEMAVLYGLSFFVLLCTGPGRISLDKLIQLSRDA